MNQNTSQNAALTEFLTEFAKYMLSSGVSLAQFQSAAQSAFLHAAMEHARLGNSRVNQSALAAITGLNRTQVRALLNAAEGGGKEPLSRLNKVLDGWQQDPQFRSLESRKMELPIRGGQYSFSALVRKYCGDVSYKAVLAELQKRRYVRVGESTVTLTQKGRSHFEPREVKLLSSGLAFALRQISPEAAEIGVVTAEAIYRTPPPKSRLLIRKRMMQSAKAFAADIKAAGDAEASKSVTSPDRSTRASILVLTMDQTK